ncbi:hypothetical protein [Psychrobacillus sp. NPDC096389]|uniref:hypothetical protein n=1 Tax=Psychrobacillus sp. NPDC096389 TaxID=3364490 RepID=UPI0037F19F19
MSNNEQNKSNPNFEGYITELLDIGKLIKKIGDSISADALVMALEASNKKIEIDKMQKQIEYLTTELEELKKLI